MVSRDQFDPQELQPRLNAHIRLRPQLGLESLQQFDHDRVLRRSADEATLFVRDDPCLIGVAEAGERGGGRFGVRGREPRAQCLELNDLGVAELAREKCRAILTVEKDRGRLADQYDQQQQQCEAAEQRPRPECQLTTLSPVAAASGASSGTNT